MIAPGGIHKQVGSQLRPQPGQNFLFLQFVLVQTMVQKFGHRQSNQHRILDRPDVRKIGEEAELQREGFLVLLDVSVHPCGIGFEVGTLRYTHVGHSFFRYLPQAKDAMLAIKLDVIRPQNDGQIA